MKFVGYSLAGILAMPMAGWLLLWVFGLKIAFNQTESLPGSIYIIVPGEMPNKGEVVSFHAPEKARFYSDKQFLKLVAGVEGDLITHDKGSVFLNGKRKAAILSKTWTGEKLVPGPQGPVPANHFFVLGNHERSYDSRYKSIGFIHKDLVVGRAIELF